MYWAKTMTADRPGHGLADQVGDSSLQPYRADAIEGRAYRDIMQATKQGYFQIL